jgi:hypothetical protein
MQRTMLSQEIRCRQPWKLATRGWKGVHTQPSKRTVPENHTQVTIPSTPGQCFQRIHYIIWSNSLRRSMAGRCLDAENGAMHGGLGTGPKESGYEGYGV